MQIWMLLVCAARGRKIYSYGEIADILGMSGAGVMGWFLHPIMWLCDEKGYPPLTVLVVNQETGLPGEGLTTVEHVNRQRENVFAFDWFGIVPPQVEDFQDADRAG